MKKLFAVLLAITMVLALAACGDKEKAKTQGDLSIDEKELREAVEDLVGDTSSFCSEIKKLSGIDITFPKIVTSIGLPSSYSTGSKVSYSGMLLAGSANLDAEGFQTIIDALTPQLKGYTKSEPVQGSNTTTVTWTKDDDPGCYFKIVLSDYDGTTWVDFGYYYTDRSLLDPWPVAELEAFLGDASVLPEYAGDYRSLEVTYDPEYNADYFEMELDDATEEEFQVWLESLIALGFAEEIVEQSWGDPITRYTKQVHDGLYLIVTPRVYTYGGAYIELTREVYTNLEWPVQALTEAYGQPVANVIPQIDRAAKRSFIFETGNYHDTLRVENNASAELFRDYCSQLENAGFALTNSSSYSDRNTYEMTFDNWDRLSITVEYWEDSYSETNILELEITFTEYTGFGIRLPENVEIVYETTMVIGESAGTAESRIIKIGESYYMTGVYLFDVYYQFNEETRTWTVYNGEKNDDGTVTWSIEEENVNRTRVDDMLKYGFQRLGADATKAEPVETKLCAGVTCVKYTYFVSYSETYSYDYVYWVDEATNLVFDYHCVYTGGETSIVITGYDTSVTSFGDIELP